MTFSSKLGFGALFFFALFITRAWADTGSDVAVPEITVFGSAKSSTLDIVPTVSELSGVRLTRKKQSSVGETLSREVGVTSSQFGPNASRPVIRGMEGDRIRVLQNGTGVLDASSASPDHGVALDPLVVDRFEIVRGPGALLYGSSAIGGVVNMVTTRIPEKVPESVRGKGELRASSTDMGRSAGVGLDLPAGRKWAVHADGVARGADDYHGADGRVSNSFNRTGSEAVGASYVFDDGFVGASVSNYNSTYGTVAEKFVKINMLQQRADVAAGIHNKGWVRSLKFKNSFSHYKHDELENGETGTTFKNDGDEARVDVQHAQLGGWTGVLGAQANQFRFAASGDESFLPETNNRAYSAFLFEELEKGRLRPSFGARTDATQVASVDDDNFGSGSTKNFAGGSVSVGVLYQVTSKDALVLNGAYTERAPNYMELFANGRHVATAQNIVGDSNLGKEKGRSVELSWRHKGEESQGSLGAFTQEFTDFIALVPTGTYDSDPDEPFQIFDYRAVRARIYGAEAEYRLKLPPFLPSGTLDLEFKADAVRGVNRDTGDNLPRMTPVRESVALIYKANRFQTDLEVQRSERQTQLAPNETATDAYTLLNAGIEVPVRISEVSTSLFARVNNVFNAEARNHVSEIKDLAPLPGRNFIAGLQASF